MAAQKHFSGAKHPSGEDPGPETGTAAGDSAPLQRRLAMTAAGAVGGLAFMLLSEGLQRGTITDRAGFGVAVFLVTFFTAYLGLAGPLGPRRAAGFALPGGLALAGLMSWAALRFDAPEDLFNSGGVVFAALMLVSLPLPFVIAASRGDWRNYMVLFSEAWGMVLRFAAAWLFTGVVWAVVLLSSALLGLVGLFFLEALLDEALFAWLLTGAMLGLGVAVVDELGDVVSPWLLLRLLRILLPAVLVVLVIFLVALPLQGTARLFGSFSAAAIMLIFVALGATLVTSALERNDAEASRSVPVIGAARLMALVLVLPAGLAVRAIWLRVAEYGWTPNRVFAAALACLAVFYGALYLVAALSGAGWRNRVRAANIWAALALIGVSLLILTPVLNPERIAAASQLARIGAGNLPASMPAFDNWGQAGTEALAALQDRADAPGEGALAEWLRSPSAHSGVADDAALRAELTARMPVMPAGAGTARDAFLAARYGYEMQSWSEACRRPMANGAPGCVLVFADLWPDLPGDEALVLVLSQARMLVAEGYAASGEARMVSFGAPPGISGAAMPMPRGAAAEAVIARLQQAPPALVPLPGQAVDVPGGQIVIQR